LCLMDAENMLHRLQLNNQAVLDQDHQLGSRNRAGFLCSPPAAAIGA
jgi:hypothetical protein